MNRYKLGYVLDPMSTDDHTNENIFLIFGKKKRGDGDEFQLDKNRKGVRLIH